MNFKDLERDTFLFGFLIMCNRREISSQIQANSFTCLNLNQIAIKSTV